MKILMVWELGNGFGHIARLLPIAEILISHGHTLTWVVPDMSATTRLPPGSTVIAIPRIQRPTQYVKSTWSISHILYNQGYEEPSLADSILEWHSIFDQCSPDMIIFDYSPSVIIANLSRGIKMFQIGDGFTVPPQVKPYGVLIPASTTIGPADIKNLIEVEDRLLVNINAVMSAHGVQPLSSLAQLYGTANNAALLSYPELDHYGYRNAGYYGVMTTNGTEQLPKYRDKKHVLVYLKDFENVKDIFNALVKSNYALSVHVSQPAVPAAIIRKLKKRKNTKVYYGPVNFESAGQVCDLMVSHGNHTTTAQALKVGLPILTLPIDSEKVMVSDRIMANGAGMVCNPNDSALFSNLLSDLINTPKYKNGAVAFQQKYASFDAVSSMASLVSRIEIILRGE